MNLMQANAQWSTRPADQRFTSLTSLDAFVRGVRERSAARVVSSRDLTAEPVGADHKGLAVRGSAGTLAAVGHGTFGQLATLAGAPAGYLRSLPSEMAADCINYGLKHARDVADVGVLLTRDADNASLVTLRAATGPNYGRIWGADLSRVLLDEVGDGVTGRFTVPGVFGKPLDVVTKDDTTLYASPDDMFVFMADETNRVTVQNRRNGESGTLARGFMVSNSETGNGRLKLYRFFFDYACSNRIIWGACDLSELAIRHTKGAPDRYLEEFLPTLRAFIRSTDETAEGVEQSIRDAQAARIQGDVNAFLSARFTRSQTAGIVGAHMADEGRPIESLWDAATGITAYARGLSDQASRIDMERDAGKILAMA